MISLDKQTIRVVADAYGVKRTVRQIRLERGNCEYECHNEKKLNILECAAGERSGYSSRLAECPPAVHIDRLAPLLNGIDPNPLRGLLVGKFTESQKNNNMEEEIGKYIYIFV